MNMYPNNTLLKHRILPLALLAAFFLLGGCAAQTGIPGHGGGKRFAIEQELVAASTRMAIKQIDLAAIRGKKVNIYVNAMGDTGAGNLTGGRFSLITQLHGYYQQQPQIKDTYIYPRYDNKTTLSGQSSTTTRSEQFGETTTSSSDTTNSQSTTSNTLHNAPIVHTQRNAGTGSQSLVGVKYEGLGAYHNSEEFNTEDLQFLTAIVQTYLFLQGVYVVPPSEAEVDVYVTVDVFGTAYTRVDWILANNEILRAKTGLEVFAVDTASGALLMPPQTAVAESEYNEQYILWAGPVSLRKTVKEGEPLLANFSDARPGQDKHYVAARDMAVPIPFQRALNKSQREAAAKGQQKWQRARAGGGKAQAVNICELKVVEQRAKEGGEGERGAVQQADIP